MPKNTVAETEDQRKAREAVESIATNIMSLAQAVERLINGPLKRKALIALLASSAQLPKDTVDRVLKAFETLESDWLNKK